MNQDPALQNDSIPTADAPLPTPSRMAKRQRAAECLSAIEHQLQDLNIVLEQRVAERTAELQVVNALLREREESLQFVLTGSRLGTWDWNLVTGEVSRNDYWAEMLGFTPQEVDDALVEGWLELIHPEDRERAWQSINAHLAGSAPVHETEYRMRTRDGGYRWVLDRARIVSRDEAGRPLRMSGTHEDITDRKHLQEVLEESHRRLMTVLNAMEATIYVADMDTHEILFLNQSARQTFGPVEGQLCYQVLQGLDAPCPFCTNDQLLNVDGSPAGVCAWEFQNQLNQRWYDLRDCAVRWTDGRLVRMEIATDITERKHMELRLRQSEERFRLAFENANSGMCLVDLQGRIMQVNDRMSAIFGYSRQELEGMTVNDLTYPEDLTTSPQFMAKAIQGLVDSVTFDKRYRHRDGHLVFGEVASSLVRDDQGQPLYFISQVQDVTTRLLAEAQLRASEQRFRLVADHALDNIWVMGPDYRHRYLSPSIQSLVGYSVEEFMGLTLDQMLMPESLVVAMAYFASLDEHSAAGRPLTDYPFRGEIELRTKEGTGIWTEIIVNPLVDDEGRLLEFAGVTRDIRERKRHEAQLQQAREAAEAANRALQSANDELHRLATTDRLTGMWNRAYFEEVAAQETARAARYGEPLSLLLFDIDYFKVINDTHGHLIGDQVLIALTRRVGEHLRANDVLARWGGEEFVVMLPHCAAAEALRVAEKLRALVQAQPFALVGQVTASFGVADFRPTDNLDTWLKRADDALYAAKAAGRNQVCLGASPPS